MSFAESQLPQESDYQGYMNELYQQYIIFRLNSSQTSTKDILIRMQESGIDFVNFLGELATNPSFTEGKRDFLSFLDSITRTLENSDITNLTKTEVGETIQRNYNEHLRIEIENLRDQQSLLEDNRELEDNFDPENLDGFFSQRDQMLIEFDGDLDVIYYIPNWL